MDNQKKTSGVPPKNNGQIDPEERNRLMRIEVERLRQCLFNSERERAAMQAEFEKVEDILDILNTMNKQNAENLQQMHNNQKSFIDPTNALVTKELEVVKKLDFLEQKTNQFIASNFIPNDDEYDNNIRQLEERIKEQDKEMADSLAALSKREDELRELKNELAEIHKSTNSVQLEIQRRRDTEEKAKRETWRKKEAEHKRNIENIQKNYDDKLSIINSDIDTLENIIQDESIEFRMKMKKAFEQNYKLKDELKFVQDQLKGQRNKEVSSTSPSTSGRSNKNLSLRKRRTDNIFKK